jgi:hypothetical protein
VSTFACSASAGLEAKALGAQFRTGCEHAGRVWRLDTH